MDLKELNNLNMDDLKAKVLAFADKKTLIKKNDGRVLRVPTSVGPFTLRLQSIRYVY